MASCAVFVTFLLVGKQVLATTTGGRTLTMAGYRDSATTREFDHLFTSSSMAIDDSEPSEKFNHTKSNGDLSRDGRIKRPNDNSITTDTDRKQGKGMQRGMKMGMRRQMLGKGSGSETSLESTKKYSGKGGKGKGGSGAPSSSPSTASSSSPSTAPSSTPSVVVPTSFPTRPIESQNDIVTCISVIDENGGRNVEADWATFRSIYPNRPLCLLQPVPADDFLSIPSGFLADTNNIFSETTRDFADDTDTADWYDICNLDLYKSKGLTNVILFVDNSGSLITANVQSAFDLFADRVAANGFTIVSGVYNSNEDYLTPCSARSLV